LSEFYASSERGDWMTPSVWRRRIADFSPILLDPCAPIDQRNWFAMSNVNGAGAHNLKGHDRTKKLSGLSESWAKQMWGKGCIYVNPPYGRNVGQWSAKMAQESVELAYDHEMIAMIPASLGAKWWQAIWDTADVILFPSGRLEFEKPESQRQSTLWGQVEAVSSGNNCATFWAAIPYWGARSIEFTEHFSGLGNFAEVVD